MHLYYKQYIQQLQYIQLQTNTTPPCCFPTTRAVLSSWDRDRMGCHIYYMALCIKSLVTPDE